MVTLRSQFGYDADKVSQETGIVFQKPSKTQQHQKEDADINVIVKRFGLTGKLPEVLKVPQYGDYSNVTDYQSALNTVKVANENFMQLPAHIRKRFNDNPQEYLDFFSNIKSNMDEAIKLGLVKKSVVTTEVTSPTVNP